jgi:hypothetical protein
LLLVSYSEEQLFEEQYIAGTVILFVSINISEGTSNSLLTKLLPKNLARGFFNAGFLCSLFALGGKLLGNILMTIAALHGVECIMNRVFITGSVVMVATLLINSIYYRKLIHKFHKY